MIININLGVEMKIRHAITCAAVAVMAAALAPSVVQAAESGTCMTYSKRYFLGGGTAITLRVAYVDAALNICYDDNGGVASSSAAQTVGTTGPGSAAGWNISAGNAVVEDQRPRHVKARFTGTLRVCAATVTPICSPSSQYDIWAEYAPPAIGPAVPMWTHGPNGAVSYYDNA